MTAPTTAAFVSCSHCRRILPVETLREYRGGNKRLMRYCPTCWAAREKALAGREGSNKKPAEAGSLRSPCHRRADS